MSDAPGRGPPVEIAFESLSIGHAASNPLLEGVDLRLDHDRLLLRGANASGKSTLLLTISGQMPPLAGRVTVNGTAPVAGDSRIGIVTESIAWPERLRLGDISWLLGGSAPQMSARFEKLCGQLGVLEDASATLAALSLGTRHKVFIALALARSPQLLLLDEVLAGVDAAAVERLDALVSAFDGTVIQVLHGPAPPAGGWQEVAIEDRHVVVR